MPDCVVAAGRVAGDSAALDRLRSAVTDRREAALVEVADRADHLYTADDHEKVEFRRLINSINYFDKLLVELVADPLAARPEAHHDGK